MNLPNTELAQFLLCIGVGAGIGAIYAVPVFISRWRSGEKLIQQQRPNPPWTWPLGILTFGVLALTSFLIDRYIFGSAFALLFFVYAVGFILDKNKKKANKAEMATPRKPSD